MRSTAALALQHRSRSPEPALSLVPAIRTVDPAWCLACDAAFTDFSKQTTLEAIILHPTEVHLTHAAPGLPHSALLVCILSATGRELWAGPAHVRMHRPPSPPGHGPAAVKGVRVRKRAECLPLPQPHGSLLTVAAHAGRPSRHALPNPPPPTHTTLARTEMDGEGSESPSFRQERRLEAGRGLAPMRALRAGGVKHSGHGAPQRGKAPGGTRSAKEGRERRRCGKHESPHHVTE